jgi:phosphatidylserine/phosphatidylglycerophosphate/cardiolipin synthase-like enzyme
MIVRDWQMNREFKRLVRERIPMMGIIYDNSVSHLRALTNHTKFAVFDRQRVRFPASCCSFFIDWRKQLFVICMSIMLVHKMFTVPQSSFFFFCINSIWLQIITGSCNWETRAFDSNSEGVIVIEHSSVAEIYECIFETIRARPPVHFPHNHPDSFVKVCSMQASNKDTL